MLDRLREDLLYYVWKTKYFDHATLCTIDGQAISIQHYGEQNFYSGPDFTNAKIVIGETLWAGNVEMHIRSSDWKLHNHHADRAYQNVILHVVYEHDKDIVFSEQDYDFKIPTLELKGRISDSVLSNYMDLLESNVWIPCEKIIGGLDQDKINLWKHRLLTERLEEKIKAFIPIFQEHTDDWERLLYVVTARYLGAHANMDAFTILAEKVDHKIVKKNSHQPEAIDAIYFGQAGLLHQSHESDYGNELLKMYVHLSHKYMLTPMDLSNWKYSGVMPAGFPDLRIAQLSAIMQKNASLFSSLLLCNSADEMRTMLEVEVHEFWKTHYSFQKESKARKTTLSNAMKDIILINAFLPVLFMYGSFIDNDEIIEKVLHMYSQINGESNSIIQKWKSLGVATKSTLDTQSLLHLKKYYCNQRQCMQCIVGAMIMKL